MLILILIIQYSQYVVLSIEKCSNNQNHSSDSHHPIKMAAIAVAMNVFSASYQKEFVLYFFFLRSVYRNVTAYLGGYTGQICLRLNLYFQHIKKLLQSKKIA